MCSTLSILHLVAQGRCQKDQVRHSKPLQIHNKGAYVYSCSSWRTKSYHVPYRRFSCNAPCCFRDPIAAAMSQKHVCRQLSERLWATLRATNSWSSVKQGQPFFWTALSSLLNVELLAPIKRSFPFWNFDSRSTVYFLLFLFSRASTSPTRLPQP
jgi:hypothetical protein